MQKAHKPVGTCEVINFLQLRKVPSMEIHASSRLNLARNNRCTNAKKHSYKKLRVWGAQKCKHTDCAKSAQTGRDFQINQFLATAHSAVNGNSRKFMAKPSPEQSLH